jgi:tetratricopeptide (TPR) repeat protein
MAWKALTPLALIVVLAAPALGQAPGELPATPADAQALQPIPVSAEQAREFAEQIEHAIRKGDGDALDRRFDYGAIAAKALAGLDDGRRVSAMRAQLEKEFSLGDRFCEGSHEYGCFRFLRVLAGGGAPQALFRSVDSSGLNYYSLALARAADGGVKVSDVYLFADVEWLSDRVRHSVAGPTAARDPALRGALTGVEAQIAEQFQAMVKIQQLADQGDFAGALKGFAALPEGVRNLKPLLKTRLRFAAELGGAEFTSALGAFQAGLANDPALDFTMVEPLIAQQRFPEALAAVDRFERRIGGDPYLHSLRSGIYYEQGNLAKAKELCRAAVAADPSLEDVYWTLVGYAAEEKDFAELTRLLTTLETKLKVRIGDISNTPLYADYVRSKEFVAWNNSRKGQY